LEEAVLHAAGKRDAGLWCYLSLSRAITGLTDDALSAAQKAVELAPQSPRAHAFYAATAAIVAARAGDLMLATAFIQEAMDSLQRSRKRHAEGLFRRMETLLARGRLMTVMCDDAEAQENGRKDLLEILELTSANQDAELGFDVRGTRDLFRVNAAFFLAMALLESDNREAATPWFEEVIALDPISPFGKAAYERLGQGYA
jgi:tetratricopeptide (TPR) repeat protein